MGMNRDYPLFAAYCDPVYVVRRAGLAALVITLCIVALCYAAGCFAADSPWDLHPEPKPPKPGAAGARIDWEILGSLPPEQRRTQWLMFTAEWCGPCQAAKADFLPWLETSGWEVSPDEGANVRLVDADQHPDLISRYGIGSYPTFILLRDGQEVRRYGRYPGRQAIAADYVAAAEAAKSEAPKSLGSVEIGTIRGDLLRPMLSTISEANGEVLLALGDGRVIVPKACQITTEPKTGGLLVAFAPAVRVGNGALSVKVRQAVVTDREIRLTTGFLTPELVLRVE